MEQKRVVRGEMGNIGNGEERRGIRNRKKERNGGERNGAGEEL